MSSRLRTRILISLIPVAILLLAGGGFLLYKALISNPPIPASIEKQLDFVTLYPVQEGSTTVSTTTFKYDPSAQILSFVATIDGATIRSQNKLRQIVSMTSPNITVDSLKR